MLVRPKALTLDWHVLPSSRVSPRWATYFLATAPESKQRVPPDVRGPSGCPALLVRPGACGTRPRYARCSNSPRPSSRPACATRRSRRGPSTAKRSEIRKHGKNERGERCWRFSVDALPFPSETPSSTGKAGSGAKRRWRALSEHRAPSAARASCAATRLHEQRRGPREARRRRGGVSLPIFLSYKKVGRPPGRDPARRHLR